jgi:hypothetical protein
MHTCFPSTYITPVADKTCCMYTNTHTCTPSRCGPDKPGQQCGVTLHGSSKMEMHDTTINGHVSGNILLNDHASGSLSNCIVSNSRSSGVTLQGFSSFRMYRNVVCGNRVSNVLALDSTKLEAEWNILSEGTGCGLRAMGTPICVLKHNTFMGNAETGMVSSGKAKLDIRLNRVSQNGRDGIAIDGAETAVVVDNAIFENAGSGLRIKNVLDCTVTGNLLAACVEKNAPSSVAFMLRGTVGGLLADNVIQARQGSVVAGDALPQLMEANAMCNTTTMTRQAITSALGSLQMYEQKRDELSVMSMPDGTTCVAMKCSVKQLQQRRASLPTSAQTTPQATSSSRRSSLPPTPAECDNPSHQNPTRATATAPPRRSSLPANLPSSPSSGHDSTGSRHPVHM